MENILIQEHNLDANLTTKNTKLGAYLKFKKEK